MNFLRKLFYGRNGSDQLSMALVVLAVIISVIASLTGLKFIVIIAYAILIYSIFRTFSKNVSARRAENVKFLNLWYPLKRRLLALTGKIKAFAARKKDREHIYFKCEVCQTGMRVPKGKGTIEVTCPKCGNKFKKKT